MDKVFYINKTHLLLTGRFCGSMDRRLWQKKTFGNSCHFCTYSALPSFPEEDRVTGAYHLHPQTHHISWKHTSLCLQCRALHFLGTGSLVSQTHKHLSHLKEGNTGFTCLIPLIICTALSLQAKQTPVPLVSSHALGNRISDSNQLAASTDPHMMYIT